MLIDEKLDKIISSIENLANRIDDNKKTLSHIVITFSIVDQKFSKHIKDIEHYLHRIPGYSLNNHNHKKRNGRSWYR